MARQVKDFDQQVTTEKYKVVADCGGVNVTVYDNYTGDYGDRDYYAIYAKIILKIRKNKNVYVLVV